MGAGQRRGLKKRTSTDAENDREAMKLFEAGNSYRAIAKIQGCSLSTAHTRVWRGMDRIIAPAVEQLRATENAKLDAIEIRLFDVITAKHPLVSNGKRFDDLEDAGPVIAALNTWLRLMERRARLNGLDAPQLHDVKVSEDDGLESEFRRLVAQLASRTGGPAGPHAAIEPGKGDGLPAVESR